MESGEEKKRGETMQKLRQKASREKTVMQADLQKKKKKRTEQDEGKRGEGGERDASS